MYTRNSKWPPADLFKAWRRTLVLLDTALLTQHPWRTLAVIKTRQSTSYSTYRTDEANNWPSYATAVERPDKTPPTAPHAIYNHQQKHRSTFRQSPNQTMTGENRAVNPKGRQIRDRGVTWWLQCFDVCMMAISAWFCFRVLSLQSSVSDDRVVNSKIPRHTAYCTGNCGYVKRLNLTI